MAIILSQVSGMLSINGSSLSHPALFTRISIGPSSRSTRAAAASASSNFVTSSFTAIAFAPSARNSAAVRSAASVWISAIATDAPSSARRVAIARPIPCAAPVTIAIFPASRCDPIARPPALARNPSAVDYEGRAGGEGRVVAGEEQCGARDFVGRSDSAEQRQAVVVLRGNAAFFRDPLDHRRVDHTGADAVGADIVPGVLERGDAGQRDYAGFRRAVGGRALDRDDSRYRGGVDDRAPAALYQMRQRVLHSKPHATQVDRDHAVEALFAELRHEAAFAL